MRYVKSVVSLAIGTALVLLGISLFSSSGRGADLPSSPSDSDLITAAGRQYGVRSIATGKQEANLQKLADEHAAYMARVRIMGHQGFDRRFQIANQVFPDYEIAEVAAESWPWNSRTEAATEMFNSWRQSPGHWRTVNGECVWFAYSMAKGSNGVWYGCGLVARRR